MDKPFSQQKISQQRRAKLIKTASVALVVLGIIWLLTQGLKNSVDKQDIRIAKVTRGDIQTTITATGTLLPRYEETVASHIDSQLVRSFIENGQMVKAGQTLVELDTTKLKLALGKDIEAINIKDNQIQMRRHEMTQAIDDLEGRLALLRIDLESRQTKHQRIAKLADFGGVSSHELKEAQLDIKRTQIEIAQLQQKIKNTQNATLTQIEGLELEKSILERSRLETVRLIDRATVKAPLDGLVVWLNNEEGSAVSNGQSLVKIADTSGYKVTAKLSDFYTQDLYQGMPATFEYNGNTYQGQIASIVSGQSQGSLELSINLADGQDTSVLRQRQRVELNLVTGELKDTLMIAKGPFVNGSGIHKVFVLAGDGAVRREITIGPSNATYYQIKAGVQAGEQVIISDVSEYANLTQFNIN